MSVTFRQRTPGEYARILWKRKWLILLPTIAIAVAVTLVVLRLPDVYESTTLIVVKPPTMPSGIVPTPSEDTLTRQLNNISQVVTSRSSLQPLVEKFRLYETERLRGEPMESVVDRMRRDIHVEVNTTRNDITNGFNITFRGRDPRATQGVTAELASKYIDAQTTASSTNSRQTKEFFESKIAAAKEELDAIDKQRIDFMTQNLGSLPSEQQSLGVQLTGLYEQQKSLIADIGRLRDQQNTLSARLGDLNKQKQQEIENVMFEVGDPKKSPDYIELARRESDLEAELRNMLVTLKPKNPDVVKKKEELESVHVKMQRVIEDAKARAADRQRLYESNVDPRVNEVKYSMEFNKNEIARQQKMLNETNGQLAAIQQRINGVPGAAVHLERLDRDYKTKQESYNALLEKQRNATMISDVNTSQQGESISVIDPANLPSRPVAPKRGMLALMGILLGLGVGLAFAAVFEVPRLLTVQTTSDAEHYTGLPVLVAVPELLTPQEARRIPRRRLLLVAAGIVATIVSIPALALALRWTHIFDRFVS
ncbi:MAG TPA: GNVR domain-containing protein [Pyrinomonadaceae bacterium]|jgi:polysaccharide chain length determinant protein (PEP-CTERM system associated)